MENDVLNETIINGMYYSMSATIATNSWNKEDSLASRPTPLNSVACVFICNILYN
jgi:hypothetical protein